MKPGTKIDYTESDKMENMYKSLISRHNVLCDIEQFFVDNKIAKKYFDYAENDVLESGNCSLSVMMCMALERMAEDISDYQDDEEKMNSYYDVKIELDKLKRENQRLKLIHENVQTMLSKYIP